MLQAIFYARFHPERGRSIIHQYPSTSIISSTSSPNATSLFNVSDISAYITPPYELCDRPLSISSNGHSVLGFPISLENASYDRNRFTFNVCFVLREEEDTKPWKQVVRKTALFFKALEGQDGLLLREEDEEGEGTKFAGEEGYPEGGVIYTLLETIFEDLNAYRETCAKVTDDHVLTLRLSTPCALPPEVQSWDVPLLVRSLPTEEQWTWAITLRQIWPHVDGVKHVERIAEVADVEIKMVKRVVREMVYHERAILLDLFHFHAIYAQTAEFAYFVKDEKMQEECRKYITVKASTNILGVGGDGSGHAIHQTSQQSPTTTPPTKKDIIKLYTLLSPGLPLHDFVITHSSPSLRQIDIRRFITFGTIKGFLRRIHKYALAVEYALNSRPILQGPQHGKNSGSSTTSGVVKVGGGGGGGEKERFLLDRAWKKAALSSGWATPPQDPPVGNLSGSARSDGRQAGNGGEGDGDSEEIDEKLQQYLDGRCCMDQICVEMRWSERRVLERLLGKIGTGAVAGAAEGKFGEVVLFNR